MSTKRFIGYCNQLSSEYLTGAQRIEIENAALKELADSITLVYTLTQDYAYPFVKTMGNKIYTDLYIDREVAEQQARITNNCAVSLISSLNDDVLKLICKSDLDLLIVRINDETVIPLNIDKDFLRANVDTSDMRPKLTGIMNVLRQMNNNEVDEKQMEPYISAMHEELGNGNLYVFYNRKNGTIFKTADGEVPAYSDIDEATSSSFADEAIDAFGEGIADVKFVPIEKFAMPAVRLILNDLYYIEKEMVTYALIKSESSEKAKAYILKQNEEHGLDMVPEELLARLFERPEMYKTFLTGINDDLKFVGSIPFSAEGYSGNVMLQVSTNGNAAAVFSILDKLMRDPATYKRLFESGQLKY